MPARERTRSNGRTRGHGVAPILEARPGGAARRFAASMEGEHPAAVFFAARGGARQLLRRPIPS